MITSYFCVFITFFFGAAPNSYTFIVFGSCILDRGVSWNHSGRWMGRRLPFFIIISVPRPEVALGRFASYIFDRFSDRGTPGEAPGHWKLRKYGVQAAFFYHKLSWVPWRGFGLICVPYFRPFWWSGAPEGPSGQHLVMWRKKLIFFSYFYRK